MYYYYYYYLIRPTRPSCLCSAGAPASGPPPAHRQASTAPTAPLRPVDAAPGASCHPPPPCSVATAQAAAACKGSAVDLPTSLPCMHGITMHGPLGELGRDPGASVAAAGICAARCYSRPVGWPAAWQCSRASLLPQ